MINCGRCKHRHSAAGGCLTPEQLLQREAERIQHEIEEREIEERDWREHNDRADISLIVERHGSALFSDQQIYALTEMFLEFRKEK